MALHHMTALEASPGELVEIAYEVGCQHVCLFGHVALPDLPFEVVTSASVPEVRARMVATGVTVTNIEFFMLTEDVDLEAFRPAVEVAAELEAQRLVTIVFDTEVERAAENLARMGDLAADHGLVVGLGVEGMTPGCASLETGVELLRLAGRPNIALGVDCLHLVRTATTPEDVAALPAELFGYAQICDGADLRVSSDYLDDIFDRLIPGDGVFPVSAYLDALPAATAVDIEVPSRSGRPVRERAQRAAAASRAMLERARPTR
jgi:sugar phosphate isomerase/epimerase